MDIEQKMESYMQPVARWQMTGMCVNMFRIVDREQHPVSLKKAVSRYASGEKGQAGLRLSISQTCDNQKPPFHPPSIQFLLFFSKSFSSFSLLLLPKHLAGSRGVSLLPPDCKAHAVVWQETDCMNVGQFLCPEWLCFDNPCDSSSCAETLSAVNKELVISFSC